MNTCDRITDTGRCADRAVGFFRDGRNVIHLCASHVKEARR